MLATNIRALYKIHKNYAYGLGNLVLILLQRRWVIHNRNGATINHGYQFNTKSLNLLIWFLSH